MNSSKWFFKGLKLVGIFFVFLGISQMTSQVGVSQPEFDLLSPLLEKTEENGTVRVIIKLDVPAGIHGSLSSSQRAVQQVRIRNAQDNFLNWIDEFWWQNPSMFKTIPYIAVELNKTSLEAAATYPGMLKIEEDKLLKPGQIDPTLLAPELSQSIPLIGGVNGEFNGFTGAGQAVAILDTGVDNDHVFFPGGKISREACFSTTGFGGTTVCPDGSQEQIGTGAGNHCSLSIDGCDHGTHVAGIAAGNSVSFSGVAKDADIIAIQVFSSFTGATCNPGPSPCVLAFTSDIIDGLEHVLDLHNDAGFTTPISAANLSLGGSLTSSPCPGEPEQAAIINLRSVGIATVVASGNDGQSTQINFPACIPEAISVGSTTKSDNISGFSNRDNFLDLMAPGSSIESSVPNDNFAFFFGTSMATPHVAGAFTVLHEAVPSSTVQEKLDALKNTGVDITDSATGFVYKRIQLNNAVVALNPPPVIVLFVADDLDDGDTIYSAGDTLTITFDVDTNQPAGTPTQLFNFSNSLGSSLSGNWTAADTYTIAVNNISGNSISLGSTTATPTGAGGFEILDSGGTSDPSSATSPTLSGDFGIDDVIWSNEVNVNTIGNNISKSDGGSSWNAGAVSTHSLTSGNGFVEATLTSNSGGVVFGLSKGDTDQNWTDIDFGASINANGFLYVLESGNLAFGPGPPHTSGDIIRVEVSGSNVLYKKNGAIFYTSSVTVSGANYPFLVDTAIKTVGASLNNVEILGFSPPPPPPAPLVTSFIADDPDNGDVVYSTGDTLIITFDTDTNQPAGTPTQLFNFSDSLGSSLSGNWTTADTYTITVNNISGNGISLGSTTATATGAGGFEILDSGGTSDPSSAISPTLSGDFGVSGPADVTWANPVNISTVGNNISKSSGGSNWNAGAVSTEFIQSGNGFVEAALTSNSGGVVFGLSKGDTDQNWTDIDFGASINANGFLYVLESGNLAFGPGPPHTSGDIIRVEVSGSNVLYKKNGAIFYTSSVTVSGANYPFLVDTAIKTVGASLNNVQIEGAGPPPPPSAPAITSLVADDPDNGDLVYSADDTLTITFDANTNQPVGTPTQLFNFSDNLGSSLSGNWTDVDTYTITVNDITGNGVSLGSTTATPTGAGGFEILDSGGTSDPSSDTSPTLSGDFGISGPAGVTWANPVNVNTVGNNISKSGGGSSWNAGAVSVEAISSRNGFVEGTLTSNSSGVVFGLSKGDTNQNWTDIDFGASINANGFLYVLESGSLAFGPGPTYTSGDIIRVEVSGSNVLYKKNGTAFYTSAVTISEGNYPLLVDTAIKTVGASLNNVQIDGAGPPPPPSAPVITSFVADDPDNGDVVYSTGDTLTITFDADTNQPAGTPTQLFNFSDSLGSSLSGNWTTADIYTVTVNNISGNGISLGSTIATPTGAGGFEIFDSGGTSDPSSATSPTLSGDFGVSGPTDVTWTNPVNVNTEGNDISKNSGGSNWNAGAVSTQSISSGNGFAEGTLTANSGGVVFGLSKGDTDQNWTDIDFGASINANGFLYVLESGSLAFGPGSTYTSGDIIRVEVSGSNVLYKKNGVTFHTSEDAITGSSYPLLTDTSIKIVGVSLDNVQMDGISGGASSSSNNPTKLVVSTDIQSFDAAGATTGITLRASFVDENGLSVDVANDTQVTFSSTLFVDQIASTTGGAMISTSVIFNAPASPEAVVVTASTNLAGVAEDTLTLFFNEPGVRATQVAETNFSVAGKHKLTINTSGIRSITVTKGFGVTPVTTAKFDHNPAGPAPFSALGFYDVHLDNPLGVTQLVIEFCPATLPPGVFFWKNNVWQSVSTQSVVNDCVQVTVNTNTFPNLNDLSGQFFGVGANVTGGDPPIWENIMAFPTPEKSLGEDLNTDGDLLDTVLRYKDIESGFITNTGIAVSGRHRDVDIYEDTIVFVEESQYRTNLISTYNIKTGELKHTGAIGYRPTIYKNIVSISGDTLRFYNLDTGILTDTGISGHIQALWGNVIAYHRAVVKTSHPTIRYYNIEDGRVINTKVAGHYPAIYENLIVFTTDERLIKADLNGDGDTQDSVIRYYDIDTQTLHNTRQVGIYPMIHGERIVFSTHREIRYFDLNLQQAFSTGELGTEPDVYGDTITYYLWEKWPVEDLNGDGDQGDPIVRTYQVSEEGGFELDQINVTPPDMEPLDVYAMLSYPNPVNEDGWMNFVVTGEGIRGMEVRVYNLAGNIIFDSGFRIGQMLQWNLRSNNRPVANGVYLYVISVRGFDGKVLRSQIKKSMILR